MIPNFAPKIIWLAGSRGLAYSVPLIFGDNRNIVLTGDAIVSRTKQTTISKNVLKWAGLGAVVLAAALAASPSLRAALWGAGPIS